MPKRGPKKHMGMTIPDIATWMKYKQEEREEYAKMLVAGGLAVLSGIIMLHFKDLSLIDIDLTGGDKVKKTIFQVLMPVPSLFFSNFFSGGDKTNFKSVKAFLDKLSDEEKLAIGVCVSSILSGFSYWILCHPDMVASLPPDSFGFEVI